MILNSISIEEGVQDLNQVFWLFEIVLDGDEMVDAGSGVLKDSVQMCETVADELVVAFHVGDNIKETANCGLSFFLVLTKY